MIWSRSIQVYLHDFRSLAHTVSSFIFLWEKLISSYNLLTLKQLPNLSLAFMPNKNRNFKRSSKPPLIDCQNNVQNPIEPLIFPAEFTPAKAVVCVWDELYLLLKGSLCVLMNGNSITSETDRTFQASWQTYDSLRTN